MLSELKLLSELNVKRAYVFVCYIYNIHTLS